MALLLSRDYIDPATLTGYVREALADREENTFSLNRWLPNRMIDDLDYRFARGSQGLTEAATYRSWDTESPIAGRVSVQRVSGELPPISRKIRLGEYDRLRQRRLDSAIADRILSDAVAMMRSVAARIELARGEALETGSLSINENGVVATVDFGRSASHEVAPAVIWSDSSADILTDLLGWVEVYQDTNGVTPGAFITSRQVRSWMLQNAEIRALAATIVATPTIVTPEILNRALESHDLPPLYLYDAKVNVNGVATRVISEDVLIMAPAPVGADSWEDTELGATLWGTTAEALSDDFGVDQTEAPGIVAGAYSDQDPVAVWTKAAAISLPVMANPDLTLAADVGGAS